jgi:copper chaperone CopZ
MSTKTFEVDNIRCNGCASTIRTHLAEAFGDVHVDLSCVPRKVTVDINDEPHEKLFRTMLKELGYPPHDENLNGLTSTVLKAKSTVSCAVGKFNQNENQTKPTFSLNNIKS